MRQCERRERECESVCEVRGNSIWECERRQIVIGESVGDERESVLRMCERRGEGGCETVER